MERAKKRKKHGEKKRIRRVTTRRVNKKREDTKKKENKLRRKSKEKKQENPVFFLRWLFLWTETKRLRNKIFFKREIENIQKCFFGSCMKKCTGTIDNKTQKNEELNRRYFLKLFKNKTTFFWRDPKKKIDKRKSRKVTSRNAINQEKTLNKEGKQDDTRRKEKQEIKHRRRKGKKKGGLNFVVKNEHRNYWFFCAKTVTEMKKKKGDVEKR